MQRLQVYERNGLTAVITKLTALELQAQHTDERILECYPSRKPGRPTAAGPAGGTHCQA